MYSQFLSADADGFLGSATIQEEDLAGLTLRNEANGDTSDEWDDDDDDQEEGWDDDGDDDWDDEDLDDEDDLDDDDWDDDEEEGDG